MSDAITDIKAVNIYGWVVRGEALCWEPVRHKIMFLRDGEWVEVRLESENPEPDEVPQ
jgi:hypothetical protein